MSEDKTLLDDYFEFQKALQRAQKDTDTVTGVIWYSAYIYLGRRELLKLGFRILWTGIRGYFERQG